MSNFLKISVNLSESEFYEKDLSEDLKIDKNNITDEMMKQAGKFAWWATLYEFANDKVARMKRQLEVLEATLSSHYRNELAKDGKKTTEKEIDSAVKLDESYEAMKSMFMDAVKQASVLGVARDSFGQRKDMLRSLSMERGVGLDMDMLRDAVKQVLDNK